jgi:hypothetical protein
MGACRFRLPLILSVILCSNAFAQIKKPFDLSQQVALTNNSVRLDSLLKNITRQTGFIFSYNTRKVNHGLRFTFSNKNYSVNELLTKIKEKTGLDYSLADNHIILKSTRLMAAPLQVQAVPASLNQIKKTGKTPVIINSPTVIASNSSKAIEPKKENEQPISIVNTEEPIETARQAPKEDPKNSIENNQRKAQSALTQSVLTNNDKPKKDSVVKPSKTIPAKTLNQKKNNQLTFWVKAGISADETFYLGPVLQFGTPAIYGTVSYKTDFKLGLISYGLGTSFKLGKTLKLNLQIVTGNTGKSYDSTVLSAYDSASQHRGITAKSNLTRIGFLIEKNLSPRIILQGGLQYNLLTTKYSGTLVTENGNQPCAISPPYLLTNSTNARGDSNVKSWIGLQVNLLYIINFTKQK